MREIKVRAWNKKTNSWIHEEGCNICGEVILCGAWLTGVKLEDLNSVVVEQYTGLKDKNGKEIYEGDILKDEWGVKRGGEKIYENHVIFWCQEALRYLRYKNLERVKESNGTYNTIDQSTIEIIGNVWENPELLEE